MPRVPRGKSDTKVYHVILRGNAKQDIFLEKQDYHKFLKEMYKAKEKYQYELYAYCLMTNHVHLIIYDKMNCLSKFLQSLTVSYASYWNKKYERVGHLFQNRFLSKNVETAGYLKNLCRYIHQNPHKAGIAEMENYPWSSYQAYLKEDKMIDENQILKLFGKNKQEARKNLIAFHKSNGEQGEMQELIEYEMIEKLNDEQAKKYIEEILKMKEAYKIVEYSVEKRKECLKKLKNIKGVSMLQIARITGLTKRMVEVAMK